VVVERDPPLHAFVFSLPLIINVEPPSTFFFASPFGFSFCLMKGPRLMATTLVVLATPQSEDCFPTFFSNVDSFFRLFFLRDDRVYRFFLQFLTLAWYVPPLVHCTPLGASLHGRFSVSASPHGFRRPYFLLFLAPSPRTDANSTTSVFCFSFCLRAELYPR